MRGRRGRGDARQLLHLLLSLAIQGGQHVCYIAPSWRPHIGLFGVAFGDIRCGSCTDGSVIMRARRRWFLVVPPPCVRWLQR